MKHTRQQLSCSWLGMPPQHHFSRVATWVSKAVSKRANRRGCTSFYKLLPKQKAFLFSRRFKAEGLWPWICNGILPNLHWTFCRMDGLICASSAFSQKSGCLKTATSSSLYLFPCVPYLHLLLFLTQTYSSLLTLQAQRNQGYKGKREQDEFYISHASW